MKLINCILLLLFCNFLNGQNRPEDSTSTLLTINKYEEEFELKINKVFKIVNVNIDSTETYSEGGEQTGITHISIKQNHSSLHKVINFWYLRGQLFKITLNFQTLDYNNQKGNGRYYFSDNHLLYKEENKIQSDVSQLIFQSNIYLNKGQFLLTKFKSTP